MLDFFSSVRVTYLYILFFVSVTLSYFMGYINNDYDGSVGWKAVDLMDPGD